MSKTQLFAAHAAPMWSQDAFVTLKTVDGKSFAGRINSIRREGGDNLFIVGTIYCGKQIEVCVKAT